MYQLMESLEPEKSIAPIRVLIAGRYPLYRRAIRGVLESEMDLEVVSETPYGMHAVTLARAIAPDVVILDVDSPQGDGYEAARMIKFHLPRTGVILMAAYDDGEQLFQALRAGASAFFLKDLHPDELVESIRRVAAGERLINESILTQPKVASRVLRHLRELGEAKRNVRPLFVPLSARELEVLHHIARGKRNWEIAQALKISGQTVKNHITSIHRKLGVHHRTHAVVYALQRGWIDMRAVAE